MHRTRLLVERFKQPKCIANSTARVNYLKTQHRSFSLGNKLAIQQGSIKKMEKDGKEGNMKNFVDPVGCKKNKQYLLDLMKNDKLNIQQIVEEFDGLLEKDRILNVYIYGSRLYGKSSGDIYQVNNNSDYDLMIIYDFEEEPNNLLFVTNQKDNYCTEAFDSLLPRYLSSKGLLESQDCKIDGNMELTAISPTIVKKKNLTNGDLTYAFSKVPKCELDISIYSKNQFRDQLKKRKFNEALAFFLEKNEEYQGFILQQSFKLSDEFPEIESCFDPKSIIDSFNPFANMVWKFCKGLYDHEWGWDPPEVDIFKAKKRVIHTLRISHYAKQIAAHGNITDWHVCDIYFDDMFEKADKYNNWDEMSKVFDPIRNSLISELEDFQEK